MRSIMLSCCVLGLTLAAAGQQAPASRDGGFWVNVPAPIPTLTCSLDDASSEAYLVFKDCAMSGGMTLTGAVQEMYDKYHTDEVVQNFSAAFRADPKMLKEVQSCNRRRWPLGDPICSGYALGIARSLMRLRPEILHPQGRAGGRGKQ